MQRISKLKVQNFKSFKRLEVSLGDFDVVIGQNASGKSNFIQIFRFLRDIEVNGLDNAISMQGGAGFLRNVNLGSSEDITIEVTAVGLSDRLRPYPFFGRLTRRYDYLSKDFTYRFSLKTNVGGKKHSIIEDSARVSLQIVPRTKSAGEGDLVQHATLTISNVKGNLETTFESGPELEELGRELRRELRPRQRIGTGHLMFERPLYFYNPFMPRGVFRDIAIFDIDPKLPKEGVPITAKADLEEDGRNLSIVLNRILADPDRKRLLYGLIYDLLPFVERINVERFADKSLLFRLRETYFKKGYLPASLVSDGTIGITALIVALYFEGRPLTIVEEPERNIHPQLMSKIVGVIREASKRRQVIVTTHSPEIVRSVEPREILLIGRGKDGFSTVVRPNESNVVQTFLEKGMRMDELFVQNTIGP